MLFSGLWEDRRRGSLFAGIYEAAFGFRPSPLLEYFAFQSHEMGRG